MAAPRENSNERANETSQAEQRLKYQLQVLFLDRLQAIITDPARVEDAQLWRQGVFKGTGQDRKVCSIADANVAFYRSGEKDEQASKDANITFDHRIEDSDQPSYFKKLSLRERLFFESAIFKANLDIQRLEKTPIRMRIEEITKELDEIQNPLTGKIDEKNWPRQRKLEAEIKALNELNQNFGQEELLRSLQGMGLEGNKGRSMKPNPVLLDDIASKKLEVAKNLYLKGGAHKEDLDNLLKGMDNAQKATFLSELNEAFKQISPSSGKQKGFFGAAYSEEQLATIRVLQKTFVSVLKDISPEQRPEGLRSLEVVKFKSGLTSKSIDSNVKELIESAGVLKAREERQNR